MDLGVVVVILVALAFDFTNGFHDAANSIATVVSTRVLSPRYAVAWAAFFNFIAFLVFGTDVATTIAKDVVDPARHVLTVGVVFAGLVGAIGWNLITFYLACRPAPPMPWSEAWPEPRWREPGSGCSKRRACARSECSSSCPLCSGWPWP